LTAVSVTCYIKEKTLGSEKAAVEEGEDSNRRVGRKVQGREHLGKEWAMWCGDGCRMGDLEVRAAAHPPWWALLP
jgi:hypothetical protein